MKVNDIKKRISILLLSSLIMSTLTGCGTTPADEEKQSVVSTIYEEVEEIEIEKEEIVEVETTTEEALKEDLSGLFH